MVILCVKQFLLQVAAAVAAIIEKCWPLGPPVNNLTTQHEAASIIWPHLLLPLLSTIPIKSIQVKS